MSPVTDDAVEVEKRITGTPAAVFAYFTDPAKYTLWQGVAAELDPRPGGAYVVHFNEQTRIRGHYVLVDPPHRIVLAWGWESAHQFPPGMRDIPPGASTVEIEFIDDGDATIIKLRHSGLPSEEASGFTTFGWTSFLDRLEVTAAGGDAGPDPVPPYLAALPNGEVTR